MKRIFTLLIFALCASMMFGQDKELHHVIVVMERQYNNVELSQRTQFMNKAQRREFVINELQAFCEA